MEIEFHPLFWQDVEEQARYLEKEAELGVEFLEAVNAAIAVANNRPLTCSVLHGDKIRRTFLHKFRRHVLHFEYEEERALIRFLALFHGAENPDKWEDRL